ncbi:MAG: hypothetical protein V4677_15130 [Bacteroidota bacterium]
MIQNRKTIYLLLLLIAITPTYFIHTTVYPDWGDDFAQYVYQGQQIHSPSDVYKQVLNVQEYSSPKRSVFFSVILSVVAPTVIIQNYVNLISVLYILAAICFFLFLSKHYSLSVCFVASLAVFYNFLFLRLKSEVVPEFLFISLFCFILYLTYSKKQWVKYIIPVLLGLLVSVRFVGLSLLIAYLVNLFLSKELDLKVKIKKALSCLIIFCAVVLFVNRFFIHNINNDEVKLYGNIVLDGYQWHMFTDNVAVYARYILYFFEQEIPYWINTVITVVVFLLFAIGFSSSVKSKLNILHFAFVFYLLFLFFYPYNGDTIKYLIPIVPLLFYFMVYGADLVFEKVVLRHKNACMVACIFVVLLTNSKTIWLAIHNPDHKIGPYNASVLADLSRVTQIVGPDKSIASGKPFVINLLCDRNSYFIGEKNYKDVLSKADYYLAPKSSVEELYPRSKNVRVASGDTISLTHFYLIKL